MGAYGRTPFYRRLGRAERAAAEAALERVGLADRARARFGTLSGGQRQRVLIARALVQDARVLLLDEPLSGVDAPSAARIEAVLRELRDEGRALLVATHDVEQARRFDRVLCLHRRQVAFGRARRGAHAPRCCRRPTATSWSCSRAGARPSTSATTTTDAGLADRPVPGRASRSGRCSRCSCSALACGPLGVWILLYRQSYAAESISHGMLPGLVLAALAGAPLVLGAGGGVLLAAAAIALAGRDERLGGDTGVAVAVSALFGLGALLALSPEAPPRLQELLFGDLLGAQPRRPRGGRGPGAGRRRARSRSRTGG